MSDQMTRHMKYSVSIGFMWFARNRRWSFLRTFRTASYCARTSGEQLWLSDYELFVEINSQARAVLCVPPGGTIMFYRCVPDALVDLARYLEWNAEYDPAAAPVQDQRSAGDQQGGPHSARTGGG